ncbi:hypothetical protein Pfo_016413 [Paulownia fortunei]|nr:hypothetical protein Pfo_016413 [Paulownia fortunei]
MTNITTAPIPMPSLNSIQLFVKYASASFHDKHAACLPAIMLQLAIDRIQIEWSQLTGKLQGS